MEFSVKLRKLLLPAAIAIIFLATGIISSLSLHKNDLKTIIWSDAQGYYQYLPAVFIKHNALDQPYAYILPDGNFFNKYSYGVALAELPFFIAIHACCLATGGPADGYSAPYGFAILMAAMFYVFAGLLLMYNFLKKHIKKSNIFITLLIIYSGTNLFYYTVGEPGMSHAYSFFLFSLFIHLTQRFYSNPSFLNSAALWATFSAAVLIRPINGLFGIWFLLFEINNIENFRNRIKYLLNIKWKVLLAIPVLLIFFLPQNLYWHELTGKYWVFPYNYSWDDESFRYILSPKIFKVLFGLENGWFLYSPVALIAITGFIYIKNKHNYIKIAGLLTLILALYINSSWWKYTFGGALGYRSMIEYYPVLIITLAYLINKLRLNTIAKTCAVFTFILLIFINLRITFLYNPPWDGSSWTWARFFDIIYKVFTFNF